MTKKRVGVLISGRGSNLQALIEACEEPDYPAEIVLVISNVPGAQGLLRAEGAGILATAINHKKFSSREEFDQALASVPTASLEYHVARGDFSRWARDVLGDADLAAGLAKLETINAVGAPVDREELRHHLHARYVL